MKKITLLFALLISAVFVNAQCNAPTNIRISRYYDTAVLEWDANGVGEWDIEYGLFGFEPTGTPVVENYADDEYNLNSLPNDYLDFYIRGNCDTETSEWVGPFSFYIFCFVDLATSTINENFNNGFLPYCWAEANQGTPATGLVEGYEESSWEEWPFANSYSSPSAKINITSTEVNEWLLLPLTYVGLPMCGGSLDSIVFEMNIAITEAGTFNPAILGVDDEVRLVISPDSGLTWETIYTWDQNSSPDIGEWYHIEHSAADSDIELSEANLIAFWASSGAINDGDVDFFIDNLNIEANIIDIEEFDIKDFKFYPNPSKNSIHLSAKETINHIEIYNHLGQKVNQTTINALDAQLDIATLPKGIYFIKVQIGETSGIVSLIKD